MKFPYPEKTSQYPVYILFYWFVLWGIVIVYFGLTMIFSLTPDGKYIEGTNCIKVDKKEECIEYSRPYYIPAGAKIRNIFLQSGIITGWICIIVGSGLALKGKSEK